MSTSNGGVLHQVDPVYNPGDFTGNWKGDAFNAFNSYVTSTLKPGHTSVNTIFTGIATELDAMATQVDNVQNALANANSAGLKDAGIIALGALAPEPFTKLAEIGAVANMGKDIWDGINNLRTAIANGQHQAQQSVRNLVGMLTTYHSGLSQTPQGGLGLAPPPGTVTNESGWQGR